MASKYSPEKFHQPLVGSIKILNMINPFTYSIQCQDCISLEEMNLILKKLIPECSLVRSPNVSNMLNFLVIVKDLDHKYYRGLIKYVEKPDIYHINRIDIGDDVSIQRPTIYLLPKNLCSIEKQSHLIKLYGISPSPEVTIEKLNNTQKYLIELISNIRDAKLKECFLVDGTYYGTIVVESHLNNKLWNLCLTEILFENSLAVTSQNITQVTDIIRNKRDSISDSNFVEKVAESIRNIDITPQHSVYLNALTSGILFNPECFSEPFLGFQQKLTSCSAPMESNGLSPSNLNEQDHVMEDFLRLRERGHGRICAKQPISPVSGGGRGKIKSLADDRRAPDLKNNDLSMEFSPEKKLSHQIDNCNLKLKKIGGKEGGNTNDQPYVFQSDDLVAKNVNSHYESKNVINDNFSQINRSCDNDTIDSAIMKSIHCAEGTSSGLAKENVFLKDTSKSVFTNLPGDNKDLLQDPNDKNVSNVSVNYSTYQMNQCLNINDENCIKSKPRYVTDVKIKSLGRGAILRSINDSPHIKNTHDNSNIHKKKFEANNSDNNKCSILSDVKDMKEDSVIPQMYEKLKDVSDENDYKDRYFDLEEPVYLNSEVDPLLCIEHKKNGDPTQADLESYEKLSTTNGKNDHEPLDSKEVVNASIFAKSESEQEKEQFALKILRDYSVGQISERMKMSCGLIHGNIIATPVSRLSELKLEQHVLSNLSAKNMRELSRSQMFGVPVLLQRRNLVLIGPPNSGKTLAYVMSILSLLHYAESYSMLKIGNGPRCIFVSSCAQNVNYISQFCSAICGAKLTIITTHGGGLELERKEELTNGCEILVTTPRCLLRLLKHTSITNLSRLCHLIFDDADILLSTFLVEVQELLSNVNKMLHIRKRYCKIGVQIVFVGERWTPILEDIMFNFLDNPVLCITAHLEAALYARIKPKTYVLPPDSKINKLIELLRYTSQKIRTVIACQSAKEVKYLRPLLEPNLSDMLVAHEEMNLSRVVEVSDNWVRHTTQPILLCSDLILNELAITNAQWLIHFSMPENKTCFSERFSTIKEHLYDRIKYPKTAPPECQVHILVDDTNELQFPEIINFMERLNTPIPELFLRAVKKIYSKNEEKKLDALFCESVLMFGRCWKQEKCKKQHIFNKLRDNSGSLPVSGIMKVKLLYAHNPSHYSVRLLATKSSSDDQWTELPSNYTLTAFKMSNYFISRENRYTHGRIKMGDLVAVEVEPDLLFKRAKIIDILTRDDKCNPLQVVVHFVDEGSIEKYSVSKLLHLPEELQAYPQEAYDLYLTGLLPVDHDKSWSYASTIKTKQSISNLNFSDGDNKFFVTNVVLVAGKNLLANSFLCYEWLDLNKCHVELFSPKKYILDTGLAEINPAHMPLLMNLAFEAGLLTCLPDLNKENFDDVLKQEVQWAFLSKDCYNIVHVISSTSPSLFFLKVFKFSDRLECLEKELTDLFKSKRTKIDIIECGKICASRYNNVDRWNRAVINQVVNTEEVEVFFVDYGDTLVVPLSDIACLPQEFITRLPFQAIECSLVGILPIDNNWLDQAFEVFDKMCFNEDNKLIPMYAKVCETTNPSITNGHHFKIVLVNNTDDKEVYINKELVYRGFANWDLDTKHFLSQTLNLKDIENNYDEKYNYDVQSDEEGVWNDNGNEEDFDKGLHSKNNEIAKLPGVDDSAKVSSDPKKFDLMSIFANGDFEPEDMVSILNMLPPHLQHPLKKRNFHHLLKQFSSSMKAVKNKKEDDSLTDPLIPKNKNAEDQGCILDSSGIYHPTIYWSQGDSHVLLKINLTDVNCYQINYSDLSITFRSFLEGRYYWFNIVLFGKICMESISCVSKGLHFEIKIEKKLKGEYWPRLLYDNFKFPWIKSDPDFIKQDDVTLIESMFNKGLRKEVNTFGMDREFHYNSPGIPDTDSDSESICSKSGSEEYNDLMQDDSLDSELD